MAAEWLTQQSFYLVKNKGDVAFMARFAVMRRSKDKGIISKVRCLEINKN